MADGIASGSRRRDAVGGAALGGADVPVSGFFFLLPFLESSTFTRQVSGASKHIYLGHWPIGENSNHWETNETVRSILPWIDGALESPASSLDFQALLRSINHFNGNHSPCFD